MKVSPPLLLRWSCQGKEDHLRIIRIIFIILSTCSGQVLCIRKMGEKWLAIGFNILWQWWTSRSLMDSLLVHTWLLDTLHRMPGNTFHVWHGEQRYKIGRNNLSMFKFCRFQIGFHLLKTIRTKSFNLSCDSCFLILFEFVHQICRRLSTYDDRQWLYVVPENKVTQRKTVTITTLVTGDSLWQKTSPLLTWPWLQSRITIDTIHRRMKIRSIYGPVQEVLNYCVCKSVSFGWL